MVSELADDKKREVAVSIVIAVSSVAHLSTFYRFPITVTLLGMYVLYGRVYFLSESVYWYDSKTTASC